MVKPEYLKLRDKRVLVVDDNLINQKVMEKTLIKVGMTIEIAGDGQEAVEKLQKQSFDIVLMDYHMPVLNGIEATLKIRNELCLTVPIIAVSASNCVNRRDLFAAGMNDCIGKPFAIEALYNKLINLIP